MTQKSSAVLLTVHYGYTCVPLNILHIQWYYIIPLFRTNIRNNIDFAILLCYNYRHSHRMSEYMF